MFRIDNTSVVAALPVIPAVGTPGFFTNGDETQGLQATIVDAWWANMLQEEIIAVVAHAGIALNKTDNGQLLKALQQLFLGISGPYLPLTGGTLYNPGGSNLLTIQVDQGLPCETRYVNTNISTWRAGINPTGLYRIFQDFPAPPLARLTIDTTGLVTITQNLLVDGSISIGNVLPMEPSSPANSLNVFGEISGSAVVVRQQSSGLASNLDVYDDRFPLNAGGRWRFAIQPTTFTFALLSNTAAAGDFSTDNIVFFAYPNGQMSFNSHIWPSSDGVGGNHNLGMPGFAWSNVYYYSLAAASDAALKRDIVDLPNQVLDDIVLPLRPRQFRWIGGPPDVHWGFVASEVGEVMAAAGQDFGGHTTDAETGLQYLAYNELIAILWRGMQELAGRLEALEARV